MDTVEATSEAPEDQQAQVTRLLELVGWMTENLSEKMSIEEQCIVMAEMPIHLIDPKLRDSVLKLDKESVQVLAMVSMSMISLSVLTDQMAQGRGI